MNPILLIIDGQGGQLGAALTKAALKRFPDIVVKAVGTNQSATLSMMKAGAHEGSTGENPIRVFAKKADVILGPIGIVIADSLGGEVTPAMAASVGAADASKILIPMNRCETLIAGVSDFSTSALIDDAMRLLEQILYPRGE